MKRKAYIYVYDGQIKTQAKSMPDRPAHHEKMKMKERRIIVKPVPTKECPAAPANP
jgi:hypothetical protein